MNQKTVLETAAVQTVVAATTDSKTDKNIHTIYAEEINIDLEKTP
jgi:hypothetical protein